MLNGGPMGVAASTGGTGTQPTASTALWGTVWPVPTGSGADFHI